MAEPRGKVVSRDEWLAARTAFLAKEKEFTRLREELSRQRRELPWVRVEKRYVFDGPGGKETLADLFAGRSQLVVYHFMFSPDSDAGCKSCSFWADNFDGIDVHLAHRDVSFVAISRAPLEKIEAFRKRMGWRFKWLSSARHRLQLRLSASRSRRRPARAAAPIYNYAALDMDIGDARASASSTGTSTATCSTPTRATRAASTS